MALILSAALLAADPTYSSVFVDDTGQLHIVPESGQELLPKKIQGQVVFDSALMAPDSRTIGWLVMYPYPNLPGDDYAASPIPGALAIFRAGRVIHTFTTQQVFWDWQFQDGGKRVAYSTGPTHGGASECTLRDIGTGKMIAHWRVKSDTEPPPWARSLRK